jgi:hypothetical protein
MPRNIWTAFKANEREFQNAEKSLSENSPEIPENGKNAECKILKEIQRSERMEHFRAGKIGILDLRNAIYRKVREEFRERWADFYEMRGNGADTESLATAKAQLVADQKAVLEPRRDEAVRNYGSPEIFAIANCSIASRKYGPSCAGGRMPVSTMRRSSMKSKNASSPARRSRPVSMRPVAN